jgi:hypothetical protein
VSPHTTTSSSFIVIVVAELRKLSATGSSRQSYPLSVRL